MLQHRPEAEEPFLPGRMNSRVRGILDGLGLGADGTIWGGEVLLGDYASFERRAWLTPAPLIGLVGTAYFAGLTVGSLRIGRLVAEVGHIRSIAAFISG